MLWGWGEQDGTSIYALVVEQIEYVRHGQGRKVEEWESAGGLETQNKKRRGERRPRRIEGKRIVYCSVVLHGFLASR